MIFFLSSNKLNFSLSRQSVFYKRRREWESGVGKLGYNTGTPFGKKTVDFLTLWLAREKSWKDAKNNRRYFKTRSLLILFSAIV